MSIGDIIGGVILSVISILCWVYISFTARCKGPILSNPWIFMSKKERDKELAKVDIKAEYRQLTVVFACMGLIFGYIGVSLFLTFQMPMFPIYALVAFVIIYAIGSSVKFAMRDK